MVNSYTLIDSNRMAISLNFHCFVLSTGGGGREGGGNVSGIVKVIVERDG